MQYLVMSGDGHEDTCLSLDRAKEVALGLIAGGANDMIEIYHCRRVTEITMNINATSRIV